MQAITHKTRRRAWRRRSSEGGDDGKATSSDGGAFTPAHTYIFPFLLRYLFPVCARTVLGKLCIVRRITFMLDCINLAPVVFTFNVDMQVLYAFRFRSNKLSLTNGEVIIKVYRRE